MRTPHPSSHLRRAVLAVALTVLLPLVALAQADSGSGSTTDGGSSTGSGTDTGSGATGSGVTGSGTTSYDAPNTYDLGGGTVTLATAILNGGTVTNGTINASTAFTAYGGSITANLDGLATLTKTTSDTLILAGTTSNSGGAIVNAGTLQIGNGNAAAFLGGIVNNSEVVFNRSGDYSYGNFITGAGNVTTTGLILRFALPQSYTGTTTISAGYLVLPTNTDQGLSAATKVSVASGAFFDLSNHAQTIAGLTGAGSVYSFGGSSGHLTVNTADGERQVFSGTLGSSQPNFAFTKSGTGTLVLSGANNHTGATTVSAGSLLINGSLSNSATTVASGGTLGGTGTVNWVTSIQSGGTLAPGDSVGTLTFAGGLTLNSGAALDFDLGATSDLIAVTGGTLTGPSSGLVTLNLNAVGGFGPATYLLINFNGASPSSFDLSDFTIGTAPTGWNYTFGLTADSLQLTVASAVPEPSTYAALLGLGALGLALYRRRSRASRP